MRLYRELNRLSLPILAVLPFACSGGGAASAPATPTLSGSPVKAGSTATRTAQGAAARNAAPANESAVPAQVFVDSVGVNTHLHYNGTLYYENYATMKSMLLNANIRHIRDGIVDTTWQPYYDRLKDLGASGIHSTLVTDVNQPMSLITTFPGRIPGAMEAIENPNEYDLRGDSQWPATLAAFTKNLYTSAKNAPQTSALPIIGPSLTSGDAYGRLGNLSAYMDYGNMHNYFSGFYPGTGGYGGAGYGSYYGSIAYNQGAAAQTSGSKPIIATETGYGTAANTHGQVPEAIQAKYVPRLYLEQYMRGVPRTFEYELVDEGSDAFTHFGLLHGDGSPKLAYTALAALLNLLAEPADHTSGSLSLAISGNTQNVHHLLLHKADGRFYLAYWLETSSYDVNAGASGAPIAVAPQTITVTFGRPIVNVTTHVSDAQRHFQTTGLTPVANQISLSVTDTVAVVSLSVPAPLPSSHRKILHSCL